MEEIKIYNEIYHIPLCHSTTLNLNNMRSKTHRKIINKSIQNLGMDYVDVYIDYMWDWSTPIYDILEILNIINKIKFS